MLSIPMPYNSLNMTSCNVSYVTQQWQRSLSICSGWRLHRWSIQRGIWPGAIYLGHNRSTSFECFLSAKWSRGRGHGSLLFGGGSGWGLEELDVQLMQLMTRGDSNFRLDQLRLHLRSVPTDQNDRPVSQIPINWAQMCDEIRWGEGERSGKKTERVCGNGSFESSGWGLT